MNPAQVQDVAETVEVVDAATNNFNLDLNEIWNSVSQNSDGLLAMITGFVVVALGTLLIKSAKFAMRKMNFDPKSNKLTEQLESLFSSSKPEDWEANGMKGKYGDSRAIANTKRNLLITSTPGGFAVHGMSTDEEYAGVAVWLGDVLSGTTEHRWLSKKFNKLHAQTVKNQDKTDMEDTTSAVSAYLTDGSLPEGWGAEFALANVTLDDLPLPVPTVPVAAAPVIKTAFDVAVDTLKIDGVIKTDNGEHLPRMKGKQYVEHAFAPKQIELNGTKHKVACHVPLEFDTTKGTSLVRYYIEEVAKQPTVA